MKNSQILSYLSFSVRNVESPDDVNKVNVLSMFENARAAEGKEAMENLEKANAYSVWKMNNGINNKMIL